MGEEDEGGETAPQDCHQERMNVEQDPAAENQRSSGEVRHAEDQGEVPGAACAQGFFECAAMAAALTVLAQEGGLPCDP